MDSSILFLDSLALVAVVALLPSCSSNDNVLPHTSGDSTLSMGGQASTAPGGTTGVGGTIATTAHNGGTVSNGGIVSVGGATSAMGGSSGGFGGTQPTGGVATTGGQTSGGNTATSGGTSSGINCGLVGCAAAPLCSVGCAEICGCCSCSEGAVQNGLVCTGGCWAAAGGTGGTTAGGGSGAAGGSSATGGATSVGGSSTAGQSTAGGSTALGLGFTCGTDSCKLCLEAFLGSRASTGSIVRRRRSPSHFSVKGARICQSSTPTCLDPHQ